GKQWWMVNEERGLLPGHQWGPRPGHQRGLSHGHGQLVSVLSPGTSPSEIGEHAGVAALPLSDAEARTLAARLDEARESQLDP
ncbi:MAG: hypothetical protein ACRDZ7_14140, partial [Acidimicrobiia bacterium]